MLRHVAVGIAGLAAIAFAAPAMALTTTDSVTINIEIAPTISMWVSHANLNLLLDGSNPPENSAFVESGLNYINNVDAKIDAHVDGTLPLPTIPGGGIQFYIFDELDAATALANVVLPYSPAGALVWNHGTLNTSQELTPGVGVNTSVYNRLITYGASLPGDLPEPGDWDLTVTYTMTSPP